jgi:hypothetical protein
MLAQLGSDQVAAAWFWWHSKELGFASISGTVSRELRGVKDTDVYRTFVEERLSLADFKDQGVEI